MQGIRQGGTALIYVLLSVVLVLGSLSIALAERNAGAPILPTKTAVTVSTALSPSSAASMVPGSVPSATASAIASGNLPSATAAANFPTVKPTQRAPTATRAATGACGPPRGWVKAYVVQPGDSMFHIALVYRTTVVDLQKANCKTSYLIFAGELLWVPNAPTATAGVTIIPPFFDTPTDEPTQAAATQTPVYFTPTSAPTETSTPADP